MTTLRERIARRTLELCRVPSVTGDEAACADLVEAQLRDTGLGVSRLGNSVMARTPQRGRPLVLLVGHTDTVPPRPGDGPPRIEGGRVRGVGASDMKGGLAVMLEIAVAVAARARFDLGLVFYDREEGPWVDSGLGPVLDQVGWLGRADLAFCLEPSDNVVQVGCLGTLHLRVTYRGRAAHSARPWQGDNAIHKAAPLLSHLASRPPRDVAIDGFTFREVLSATLAQGGNTRNVIPDHFSLNLNFRFAPGREIDEAIDEVRALVGEAEIEVVEAAPSGRVVTENPLLREFLARNGNAVAAKQAWTDVARLTARGIDAVNLGPGLAAQAHQAGEYAEVALIEESYLQFERFLVG
ncbi:MAG: succinyl-diaminopimelate desuccinylase [Deltaproteobacteria bacterium]|nr:succinyl-diaminopimelate desuccinylase [Deltaproteobacteria bacterium]